MKAWQHFCTITYHKYLVAKGCFAVGLYKQGLLHDMSKYSPIEFRVLSGGKKPEQRGERRDWSVNRMAPSQRAQ